ncbi:hypothetical protein B0H14DRAFT_2188254, partial [Mycena olivaceomarginata]
GYRIQLGHPPGSYCPRSLPAHKDFVVIDTLGVCAVRLSFYRCNSRIAHRQQLMRACLWSATSIDPQTCVTFNVVRLFEVQNCLGKISAYDFVRRQTAERSLCSHRRPRPTPWQMPWQVSDIGHEPTVMALAPSGELVLPCGACPQPGINLPPRWSLTPLCRYKYELKLSEDANFKLINRNVSTEARDPIIDDSTGYFANHKDYSDHIRKHVHEQE